MRKKSIDQTRSGASRPRRRFTFRDNWKRDSFFVSTVAWFDMIVVCCIIFAFPQIEVIFIGVVCLCFSTTGIFGVYERNLKAIRIFHFWKIIFAFAISGFVIYIACDAKQVCSTQLSSYSISNCQAKLGFLAIFSLVVDSFFAAYCVFIIKRFSQKIPHLNLTQGCLSRSVNTSFLQAKRSESNSDANLQRYYQRRDCSLTSSCDSESRYRRGHRKNSSFSDVTSITSSCSSHSEQLSYGTFAYRALSDSV